MKKVMLYGYTVHNLGDDLFFYTICRHFPHVQFYLQAPVAYRKTFAELDNLSILPNDRIWHRVSRKIGGNKRSGKNYSAPQLGIYAGGSLFMEQKGWEIAMQKMQRMLHHHDQLLLIGANFGPFTSNRFVHTYRTLFQQCAAISFRDQASKALFPDMPHIKQAADIVFQLNTSSILKKAGKTVIVSVIYPSVRADLIAYDERYFTAMAEVCVALLKAGYPVLLMSFCKREKDEQAIREIRKRIPTIFRPAVLTFYYETNLQEALQRIAGARAIVATRFHAMILGWLFQKPTYPIVYNRKMNHVIRESHFTGHYTEMSHIHTLDPANILHAVKGPVFNAMPLIQDAFTHINLIESYVKEKNDV